MKRNRVWFVCILVTALLIRVGLIYYALQFRENTDILRWKDWTRISFLYGFADTYTTTHIQFGTFPNNMPPGTLYIQYIMYIIGIQISKIVLLITQMPAGSIQWLNGLLITLLFRVPAIVSDLIIGGIIYNLIKKITNDSIKSFIGMGLFLFNPVVLYNSAVWGQMDAVVNVFFIASLYNFFNKRIFLSMLLFLLCLYIKLSLVYFLPIYIILWWMHESKRKLMQYSAVITFIGFCLVLPINKNPLVWIAIYLKNNAIGEMTNITAYAFNLWWMLFRPIAIPEGLRDTFSFSTMHLIGSPYDSTKYFGISLFWYGTALFIILLIPIIFRMTRKHISNINIIKYLGLITLIAFLVLPRIHERYMYPAFMLLAISSGFIRKNIIPYIILTICNMINVYIVWHPMPISFFPYQIWTGAWFQWLVSLCTVGTVCVVYIQTLRLLYEKR